MPKKPPDTFAGRLLALREQAGLSREQLAAAASLSRQSLHLLEAGRRSPSLDTARKLVAALGLSLSAFDGTEG